MKRLLAPLSLALLAAGCGTRTEPVQAVANKLDEPPLPRGQVRIDAKAQAEAGIQVEVLRPASVARVLTANGRITLNEIRTWRVGAITEGRVVRVLVNAGDRVQAGQVLALLHAHDVHEERAAYQKAIGESARLSQQEAYHRRVRDRAKRLFDLKAGSLEQLEHAESDLRNTLAAIEANKADIERTRRHLEEFLGIPAREPEHHEAGKHGDEDLVPVKAAAAGIVLQRAITPGTVVDRGQELFVITDLSSVWMIAAVEEEHLSRLRTGMPASVTVQAYPGQPLPARITRLAEQMDAATRTVQVRLEIDNAGGRLKPEMYATAAIAIGGTEPALFVPGGAAQEVNGQTVVFVRVAPDRFEARAVDLDRAQGGSARVREGLRPGEAVVVQHAFLLKSQLLKASLGEE